VFCWQVVEAVNPAIASFDELDAASSVILVSGAIHRQGWSTEVVEWHEEIHRGAILVDQIMQQEEVDVSSKALEQSEEISIARQRVTEWIAQQVTEWIAQRVTEWTALAQVVPANTLEREIEPVPDLRVPSASAVDGSLSVDSICWENYPGADGGADPAEVFVFFLRE